jgi:osmoprotectant transport system ATP-binding protein
LSIIFENHTVHYGEKTALTGLNISLPSNRVSVLIGPSGCGKSTTLKSINKLVRASAGSIVLDGEEINDLDPVHLRRRIGYAIQNVGLFPHMTVMENIMVVPKLLDWPKNKANERAFKLLGLIGLKSEEYGTKFPHQLSGGEAQRVGVARALGADPEILLMDEPFGAVDPLGREVLQDEFIRIQRKLKKTVVFVTHDLDEAVRLADYLVIMRAGNIVQAGSPEEILKNPVNDFVKQFLGPDRALKRLSIYTADQFMIPWEQRQKLGLIWEFNEKGIPVSVSESSKGIEHFIDLDAHTLKPYSSLREAVSRVLSFGFPYLPVLGEQQEPLGILCYEDIKKIALE